jgi:hypothetical protein
MSARKMQWVFEDAPVQQMLLTIAPAIDALSCVTEYRLFGKVVVYTDLESGNE